MSRPGTGPETEAITHLPVLVSEVVRAFDFGRPATIIDGTAGHGGHAEALLVNYPTLRLIAFDVDEAAVEGCRRRLEKFRDRCEVRQGNYADLGPWLSHSGVGPVDGVLLDLGVSARHLEDPARGFSFQREGPIDMRMSRQAARTAWDLLHQLDESELAGVIRRFGEEPAARRIARELKAAINERRLRNDTAALAEMIRSVVPWSRGVHPATRTFQALRIAVNGELDNLDRLLNDLPGILKPGGRAAIIAFHSLEDRRVKSAFRLAAGGCLCPAGQPVCTCGHRAWATLTPRRAIQAGEEEVALNPRARSARLRILEKL